MAQQELHQVVQGVRAPEQTFMTLAEFLENDIDRDESVKGELGPMPPVTRVHSKISVNVTRHLDRHGSEKR